MKRGIRHTDRQIPCCYPAKTSPKNTPTHGDEICAAGAVAALLNEGVRLIDGTLSLSFANVEAFSRFDRKFPEATRWEGGRRI